MQARATITTRASGDLAVALPPDELAARRRAVVDLPWTWLTQVHGADVVTVTRPGEHAGARADAAVTAVPGAALAITTADCVPVVIYAGEFQAVGVAHAGWRGLLGGVVGATAAALRALGHEPHHAMLGPSICAAHYEFGAADLDTVAARWGDEVRGTTAEGRPALDVEAGVRLALAAEGIDSIAPNHVCTAEEAGSFWSYRARGEAGRIATVAWLEDET